MIGTTQQPQEDNKWVNLMIDSGAATHVCPLWFASQIPLHQLAHGTGPQLRTVTNQHIKLHGYRWVCVTNHSGQQIVIPFYVCEVKQPILSVTRLTLDDNPRLQRIKGFNSTLENRNHNIAKINKATGTQHRTRTDWHDSSRCARVSPVVLVAWVVVLFLLLYLVVVPHHLTQVVLGTPDVPQSLSSLLMSGPSCVCSGM